MASVHEVGVTIREFEAEVAEYIRNARVAFSDRAKAADVVHLIENVFTLDTLAERVAGRCFCECPEPGTTTYVIDQIECYANDKDHVFVRWLSWDGSAEGHVTVEPLEGLPCANLFLERIKRLGASDLEIDELNLLLSTPASFLDASTRFPRMCREEEIMLDINAIGFLRSGVCSLTYRQMARNVRQIERNRVVKALLPKRAPVCPGAPLKLGRARVCSEAIGTRSGKVRRTLRLLDQ